MGVLAGELYVLGGVDESYNALKTVEKYNGQSWEMVKELEGKFHVGGTVVIN